MKTQHKFGIIAIALLIVLSAYSYSNYYNKHPSLDSFIENPAKYDGQTAELAGKLVRIEGMYFYFKPSKYLYGGTDVGEIRILYNGTVRSSKHGFISVLGTFNKSGYFEAKEIHYHDYNNFKYVLSLLALLLFAYLFLKEWKPTRKGFIERGRDNG